MQLRCWLQPFSALTFGANLAVMKLTGKTCTNWKIVRSQTLSWVQLTKKLSQLLSVILLSLTSNYHWISTKSNPSTVMKNVHGMDFFGLVSSSWKMVIASTLTTIAWMWPMMSTRQPMSVSSLVVVWTSKLSSVMVVLWVVRIAKNLWPLLLLVQTLTVGWS